MPSGHVKFTQEASASVSARFLLPADGETHGDRAVLLSSPSPDTPATREPAAERLIVALDQASPAEALRFVERMQGLVHWYKIGLGLMHHPQVGELEDHLVTLGCHIFWDCKLHDIPYQVRRASQAIAARGTVRLLTVHANPATVAAARKGLDESFANAASPSSKPLLLACTVLTSMTEEQAHQEGFAKNLSIEQLVLKRAQLAWDHGADGFVCSPWELKMLREMFPKRHPYLVTPGIRPASAVDDDDQRRFATPREALAWGADQLVVGRPLYRASDPRAETEKLLAQITSHQAELRLIPG